MLKFDFTNETRTTIDKSFFAKIVRKFYKVLRTQIDKKLFKRNGNIELVLVGDKAIQALNREYRNRNKLTDVISFAYLEVTEYKKTIGDIIIGDIFISVETAGRQAKQKGHSLKKELEILFVHGLLHCFGFDHKNDKQEEEMERWARKVLEGG